MPSKSIAFREKLIPEVDMAFLFESHLHFDTKLLGADHNFSPLEIS